MGIMTSTELFEHIVISLEKQPGHWTADSVCSPYFLNFRKNKGKKDASGWNIRVRISRYFWKSYASSSGVNFNTEQADELWTAWRYMYASQHEAQEISRWEEIRQLLAPPLPEEEEE